MMDRPTYPLAVAFEGQSWKLTTLLHTTVALLVRNTKRVRNAKMMCSSC